MSEQNTSAASVTATSEDLGEQQLLFAVLAGLAAALIGAAIWAAVTVATEYQIGWMAVGVGFLVGYAVRTIGRGTTMIFGVVGATLALLGCVLGNLFSAVGFIAAEETVGFWSVLGNLNVGAMVSILQVTFSPMDLLFYGIAIYEGFKLSVNQVAE